MSTAAKTHENKTRMEEKIFSTLQQPQENGMEMWAGQCQLRSNQSELLVPQAKKALQKKRLSGKFWEKIFWKAGRAKNPEHTPHRELDECVPRLPNHSTSLTALTLLLAQGPLTHGIGRMRGPDGHQASSRGRWKTLGLLPTRR